MNSRNYIVLWALVVGGLVGTGLFVIPWLLGWRADSFWIVAGALATTVGAVFAAGAAIAAVAYVRLTHQLWQEAAKEREGSLMLRLIDGYDTLRDDIERIRQYYIECASSGPTDPLKRYCDEMGNVDFVGDKYARQLDAYRFRVSRFFVRTRKLVQAGFLSERVVVAALDRRAIEHVFLELIDPLDEVVAGENYKADDRVFYKALLKHYAKTEEGGR